jgi:hypothetical protein
MLREAANYNCFFFIGRKKGQSENLFNAHPAAQCPNVAVTVTNEP